MSRYELPREQCVPNRFKSAVMTLAFYVFLCIVFFGAVAVLSLAYSWTFSLVEAML